MISGVTIEQVMQLALAFVLGGGGTAIIAKKTMKNLAVTGAEMDVVELLRTEVKRLSDANDRLQKTVDGLQGQLFQLRAENAELRSLLHPDDMRPSRPTKPQE